MTMGKSTVSMSTIQAFGLASDPLTNFVLLGMLVVVLLALVVWRGRVKQYIARTYNFLRVSHPESGILVLIVLLAAIGALFFSRMSAYFQGVLTEFTGLIFDVFFIAIFLVWLKRKQERQLSIEAQQEIIDDFKTWNTKEGKLRIAGSIRRIIKMGKTDINLVGIRLSKFSFLEHDIKDLRGSVFYDGAWGEGSAKEKTILKKITFDGVDLRGVQFSPYHPFSGWALTFEPFVLIEDCTFIHADLRGAKFDGASLVCTRRIPDDLTEEIINSDGTYQGVQVVYPLFDGAMLSGASFKHVKFKNIDFRHAEGILEADFQSATGLESCVFDDEDTKLKVIALASSPTSSSKESKTNE